MHLGLIQQNIILIGVILKLVLKKLTTFHSAEGVRNWVEVEKSMNILLGSINQYTSANTRCLTEIGIASYVPSV